MHYKKKEHLAKSIILIILFSPILFAFAYDTAQWGYMEYIKHSYKQEEKAVWEKVYGKGPYSVVYENGNIPINGTQKERELKKIYDSEIAKMQKEFYGDK